MSKKRRVLKRCLENKVIVNEIELEMVIEWQEFPKR